MLIQEEYFFISGVFIPSSLRKAISKKINYKPLLGHLGIRKTYFRISDSFYFPKLKEIVREYVSTCSTCQWCYYRNVSPAGKLVPIKAMHRLKQLESVGFYLIGPYPFSNPERYRYVLLIFMILLFSARAVADAFFDN